MPKRSQYLRHGHQELADLGVGGVELGQGRQVPPGRVAELGRGRPGWRVGLKRPPSVEPRVGVEPVSVWGRRPGLHHVMEWEEAATGVVEDAIEHDAHPAPVRGVEQLAQGVIAAEQRIDLEVVVGVISVVRARAEDRGQVDRADPEILEVAEVLGDPAQVAAFEPVDGRWRVPRLEGPRLVDPLAGGEPVREDLVEDRVADPVRRVDGHRGRIVRCSTRASGQRRARGRAPVYCRSPGENRFSTGFRDLASRPDRLSTVQYDARPMLERIRAMPGGIRLFLVYALLILAGIGLSLRSVVDTAISTPVSLEGVVVMILLAYTIFTTTLVLQRKQAARGLALELASLTIPLVPLLALSRLLVEAIFVAALGLLLFRGLLRPEVRTYLNEP